jgi:predicted nucleotidyltransferase
VSLADEPIADLCQRRRTRKFRLVGSALREDSARESDVYFLLTARTHFLAAWCLARSLC